MWINPRILNIPTNQPDLKTPRSGELLADHVGGGIHVGGGGEQPKPTIWERDVSASRGRVQTQDLMMSGGGEKVAERWGEKQCKSGDVG